MRAERLGSYSIVASSAGTSALVALEVDATVVRFSPPPRWRTVSRPCVVPAGAALLGLDERLVGLVGGDLLEGRPRHEAAARGGRLVASDRHRLDPFEEFDLVAGRTVTTAFFQGVV